MSIMSRSLPGQYSNTRAMVNLTGGKVITDDYVFITCTGPGLFSKSLSSDGFPYVANQMTYNLICSPASIALLQIKGRR